MSLVFPKIVRMLPQADIGIPSAHLFVSQSSDHQIVFMEFEEDLDLSEHTHESQWEYVIQGKVDLTVEGKTKTYQKGDSFFIPKGYVHSGKIYAGYASIAFFDQKDRYLIK